MFSLSDDIKQIIRDRINELDTYIEKSEPSRQRHQALCELYSTLSNDDLIIN